MKHWTLWFFGGCAALTLGVSIPATYDALALWHNTGGAWGVALSVFALLVFEVGAVGAKLATLAIPEWRGRLTGLTVALLAVTTAANYAHGYDLSQQARATPTLAAVLADPRGAVAATLLAAALFPALLFVFLSAFTARCEATAIRRDELVDLRADLAAERECAATLRADLAARHAELATAREQTAASRANLAAERERPVLDLRTAARMLADAGAPEATIRGWFDTGRVKLVEGE